MATAFLHAQKISSCANTRRHAQDQPVVVAFSVAYMISYCDTAAAYSNPPLKLNFTEIIVDQVPITLTSSCGDGRKLPTPSIFLTHAR